MQVFIEKNCKKEHPKCMEHPEFWGNDIFSGRSGAITHKGIISFLNGKYIKINGLNVENMKLSCGIYLKC